jgi:hypothetical protein
VRSSRTVSVDAPLAGSTVGVLMSVMAMWKLLSRLRR